MPEELTELQEHAEHAKENPELAPVSLTMAIVAVLAMSELVRVAALTGYLETMRTFGADPQRLLLGQRKQSRLQRRRGAGHGLAVGHFTHHDSGASGHNLGLPVDYRVVRQHAYTRVAIPALVAALVSSRKSFVCAYLYWPNAGEAMMREASSRHRTVGSSIVTAVRLVGDWLLKR